MPLPDHGKPQNKGRFLLASLTNHLPTPLMENRKTESVKSHPTQNKPNHVFPRGTYKSKPGDG